LKYFPLALSFLLFTFAYAAKGPQYHSLRVHGMGGAFVAVADSKDALYYNPAGLNLITRLGNFEKDPEMGYMPFSKSEVRLFSAAVFLPGKEINNVIDACGAPTLWTIVKKMMFFDFGYLSDIHFCPAYSDIVPDQDEFWPDSLRAHPEFEQRLGKIDNSRLDVGTQISLLEIVVPNFGIASWLNASAAPWVDMGIFIPIFGYEPIQIDLVIAQTAFAFSPVELLSIGAGLKFAKRYTQLSYNFKPGLDFDGAKNLEDTKLDTKDLDDLEDRWDNIGDDLWNAKMAVGLDLGVLYQITRQIRLGTSVRNIFFGKLDGESITPNWSIGAMASPMFLQSNSYWARKVNFAIDYVDILDGTITQKFFSHLNWGAEIEQVAIPSPAKDMSFMYHVLFGVVGGVAGLGVGYLIGKDIDIGKVAGMGIGSAIGIGVGTIAGIKFGLGHDALRVSLGGGLEGGYPAFNVGFGVFGDAVTMRFASYAEERGLKTGQNGHRFWAGELSVGF
jgi:hypothetical protein